MPAADPAAADPSAADPSAARASLRSRLLWSVGGLSAAFLLLTGLALDRGFRASVDEGAAAQLEIHLFTLLGLAEVGPDHLALPDPLPEARFGQPGSGLVGVVTDADGRVLWQSDSLLGELPAADLLAGLPPLPASGSQAFGRHDLPRLGALFLLQQGVIWQVGEALERPLVFTVLMDQEPFRESVGAFRRTLFQWLVAVGVALLLALFAFMTWGLAPLSRLGRQLDAVEAGERDHLDTALPKELARLAGQLNAFVHHERVQRERYRTTLDDLAHSLKTPLAVLRSAAGQDAAVDAALVDTQVGRMDDTISWQLKRARAAPGSLPGSGVEVAPLLTDLCGALERIHGERIRLSRRVADGARFLGDAQDLMEVLGNLVENACKYGRARVHVAVDAVAGGLRVRVEDDGPGIDPGLREAVLERGGRADTRRPGQGIGLAVVRELVAAYDGRLLISEADLGGARVEVTLPGSA